MCHVAIAAAGAHRTGDSDSERRGLLNAGQLAATAKPELPENDTRPHKCELCEWHFPSQSFSPIISRRSTAEGSQFGSAVPVPQCSTPLRWRKCLTAVINSHLAHMRTPLRHSASTISSVTIAGSSRSCSARQTSVALSRIMPIAVVAAMSSCRRARLFLNHSSSSASGFSHSSMCVACGKASSSDGTHGSPFLSRRRSRMRGKQPNAAGTRTRRFWLSVKTSSDLKWPISRGNIVRRFPQS